jgi:plastocyanin
VCSPHKLFRLLFAATVVAGVSAPMLGAYAAPRKSSVDAYNPPKGFFLLGAEPSNTLEISPNDTVGWIIREGEHTVTPKDRNQWGDDGSETLNDKTAQYVADHFKAPGDYFYYCSIHSSPDDVGKQGVGMWGLVYVKDPNPTTTTTTPPPPSTTQPPATTSTTRQLGSTPPATTATAPTTRPTPTTAAPTTTTKGDKDKKPKDDETTTTTAPPPPPPIDLPDEAIIPALPGASTTSSADPGAPGEAPTDTPEGEAVALLKGKNNGGGNAMKLLIVSGIGLGALGIGSAGYKYANRSSKYFPA